MTPLQNNQVILLGYMADAFTFSHSVTEENFFTFTLEVERTSGTKDYLPIMISEKLIDKNESYMNKPVCVVGQFRSYNKKTEGATRIMLHIFAMDFYVTEDDPYINEAYFSGYICKNPTYRTTPLGRQISDVMIAVPRKCGKSDYIPCVIWGRDAVCVSRMDIGTQITVSGRIQSREYQKQIDGVTETKMAYEVSVVKLAGG